MARKINKQRIKQIQEAYAEAYAEAVNQARSQARIKNWKEYERKRFLLSD